MGYKITELTALGTQPADTDIVPLVDVSDFTQAPTGSTKRMTVGELADAVSIGDTGVTGDTGASGDTGVQGDTGVEGDTGADSTVAGDTGIQGDTGAGDTGIQGDTGVDGDTGVTGDTGADSTVAGDTGIQGDTGVGDTGVTGDTGSTGDTGADSTVAGDTGTQGDTGVQGDSGSAASQGDTGVTGDTGADGDTGAGIQGDTGADSTVQGDTGDAGDTGAGSDGDTGVQGDTGSQGDTGIGGTALTTKGDLLGYDTGEVRIPIGTDGQVLIADSADAQGLDWKDASAVANHIREVPTGLINDSNTTYTLANIPVTGSEQVFLNGVLQEEGGSADYTISGLTITYNTAPATGDILLVTYLSSLGTFAAGSTSFVINEVPSGLVNGVNTAFDTASNYVAGSIQVYRDGQLMKGGGEDYTETDSDTITFVSAPVTGSILLVTYQTAQGAAGNADTLDSYHANATPTANTIPVLDSNGQLPVTAVDNPYKFRVYRNTSQAITLAATWYTVEFNVANYDTNSDFDITTDYDYTVPVTGYYYLHGNVRVGSLTDGDNIYIRIARNGTAIIRVDDENYQITAQSFQCSTIYYLTAGDLITCDIQNVNSTGSAVSTAAYASYFEGYLLSL